MSIESYLARLNVNGGSIQGASDRNTKLTIERMINDSPSRSTVGLHSKDNLHLSIVSDIDTYERRRFLFHPDVKTYKGDYIYHDDFTYLITEHTIDDKMPQSIAMLCNYEFPVKYEDSESEVIVGYQANGMPIWKTQKSTHTIPCVVTSKIYSQADNAVIALADGAMTAYLPYRPHEPMPERDQQVVVHDSQYYVVDIIKTNILKFSGIDRGYLELRLQRMQEDV